MTSSGPIMPSTTTPPAVLSIGAVQFDEDEHPSHLSFAGSQMKAVHQYIGGRRVVQVLGAQPKPIKWEGYLWEDRLAGRVAILASYMVSGAEQLITWLNESYYGIVSDFDPDYESEWLAKYTIEIEVTRDANGRYTQANALSVDQQMASLLTQANQAYAAASNASANFATQYATLGTSLQNVGATLLNVTPVSSFAGQLSGLSQAITTAIGAAQSLLTAIQAPNQSTVISTSLGSQTLGSSAISTNTQQTLQQAACVQTSLTALQLMAANVNGGQSSRTVMVQGGQRVDKIAAQYYGDPTLGGQLAQINNLPSIHLPSGKTYVLSVPPLQSNNPLLQRP